MIVDKYRPEDRGEIDRLFRRVFGVAPADASAGRWDWQYGQNPNSTEPHIWIARDEGRIVGQYATMPVRLRVTGQEIDASWEAFFERLTQFLQFATAELGARPVTFREFHKAWTTRAS